MYSLTEQELNLVGLQHSFLEHDCSFSSKGWCQLHEDIVTAYAEARNEQERRLEALADMQG